jgi:hypothetical protein
MGRASGTPPALVLRCAAVLTSACVLAACSGGSGTGAGGAGSGSTGGAGRRPGSGAAISRPAFGQTFIAIGAGGGPPAFIAITGLPGGGQGGRPAISVPPIPPASSSRPIPMPLDSYEQVAGNEQEVLVEASNLLTQRCMASRGFSYTETAQPSTELSALRATENSPVGLTSLSQAQTYGYGAPKGSTGGGGAVFFGTVSGQVFGDALRTNGQAWVIALLGFSPGPPGQRARGRQEGCIQLVTSELYGPDRGSSNPDPVPGIAFQAVAWTQSDPRVLAVDKAWSACMARRGLRYRTPQAAAQHNWPSVPAPAEIATAVADVTCKTQVNLTNTWLAVEAAYQLALISQNLTALSQLQSSFAALQQRAEQLVGAGGLHAGR